MKTLEDYIKSVEECEKVVEEDKKNGGKILSLMDRDLIPYNKQVLRNARKDLKDFKEKKINK